MANGTRNETKTFKFNRPGSLSCQSFMELIRALTFYAVEKNRYAVKRVVNEMASRQGISASEMASEIRSTF